MPPRGVGSRTGDWRRSTLCCREKRSVAMSTRLTLSPTPAATLVCRGCGRARAVGGNAAATSAASEAAPLSASAAEAGSSADTVCSTTAGDGNGVGGALIAMQPSTRTMRAAEPTVPQMEAWPLCMMRPPTGMGVATAAAAARQ